MKCLLGCLVVILLELLVIAVVVYLTILAIGEKYGQ